MTDDKGASGGPYRKITHYTKSETGDPRVDAYGDGVEELDVPSSDGWGTLRLVNAAHFAGRKAERERCLEIVRQYYSCEMIAQDIEKKISGGQDGE